MDWNHEVLASLIWLSDAFVISLIGLTNAIAEVGCSTKWPPGLTNYYKTLLNSEAANPFYRLLRTTFDCGLLCKLWQFGTVSTLSTGTLSGKKSCFFLVTDSSLPLPDAL